MMRIAYLVNRHPDRVPVRVERRDDRIPDISNKKFLVPRDMPVGQFMLHLRQRLDINKSQGVFVFVNNVLPPNMSLMGQLYEEHKDHELMLNIVYALENIFG